MKANERKKLEEAKVRAKKAVEEAEAKKVRRARSQKPHHIIYFELTQDGKSEKEIFKFFKKLYAEKGKTDKAFIERRLKNHKRYGTEKAYKAWKKAQKAAKKDK